MTNHSNPVLEKLSRDRKRRLDILTLIAAAVGRPSPVDEISLMPKKIKKGSRRSHPKIPGSSQFARFSSATVAARLPVTGFASVEISDVGSPNLIGVPSSAFAPPSSLLASSPDLDSKVASFSGPSQSEASPLKTSKDLSSGISLAAVEASVSGHDSLIVDVVSPGELTSAPTEASAPPGLPKKCSYKVLVFCWKDQANNLCHIWYGELLERRVQPSQKVL